VHGRVQVLLDSFLCVIIVIIAMVAVVIQVVLGYVPVHVPLSFLPVGAVVVVDVVDVSIVAVAVAE